MYFICLFWYYSLYYTRHIGSVQPPRLNLGVAVSADKLLGCFVLSKRTGMLSKIQAYCDTAAMRVAPRCVHTQFDGNPQVEKRKDRRLNSTRD